MSETPCPERERLLAFHRGELSAPQAEEIAAHLRMCDACRLLVIAPLETVDLVVRDGEAPQRQPAPQTQPRAPAPRPDVRSGPGPPGYRLLEEIGRGAVGVVYRAHDVRLDRIVAVKVLREDQLPGSMAALRLIAEARIAARLAHPGIPAVHELGLLPDGRPFLVMRLVQGRTFQDLLEQRGSLGADRERLLDVFHHLCQTVAFAHAHRIIHRDLKPQNVMVGAFGEVQVMDWGLAKRLGVPDPLGSYFEPHNNSPLPEHPPSESAMGREYTTDHGAVLGTPAYMPPEQAAGHIDRVDLRSDVFSLGAILCQILTGQPPYYRLGAAPLELPDMPAALEQAVARLEECQAETDLVALCKRCLAADQEDRPRDAQAVADQIERIRSAAREQIRHAELENVAALVRQLAQYRRRERFVVLAGLAAALVLLGWLAAWLGAQYICDTSCA